MISLPEAFQKKKVELLQVRNCARDILPSQAVATSQSMVEGFETRAIKSPRLKRMSTYVWRPQLNLDQKLGEMRPYFGAAELHWGAKEHGPTMQRAT